MQNDLNSINTHKPYMRAREASAYMSIGLSSFWLMSKNGILTPIKIGKRTTIFSKKEIDDLIKSKQQ